MLQQSSLLDKKNTNAAYKSSFSFVWDYLLLLVSMRQCKPFALFEGPDDKLLLIAMKTSLISAAWNKETENVQSILRLCKLQEEIRPCMHLNRLLWRKVNTFKKYAKKMNPNIEKRVNHATWTSFGFMCWYWFSGGINYLTYWSAFIFWIMTLVHDYLYCLFVRSKL